MNARIGLFGGCFNPVHTGHLAVARAALAHLKLDRLIFIPSGLPPLKGGQGLLPGADRLAMLECALAEEPQMEASAAEIVRSGPSFTVDTVRALRGELPVDAALFFLLGSDCLDRLPRWKGIDALHAMLRFAVVQREGARQRLDDSRIVEVPHDAPPVSSTLVRERLARGEHVVDLVPPAVARYLQAHGPRAEPCAQPFGACA